MPFGIEGGLPLALVRALSVSALLSVFGTLMFCNFVAPRAAARMSAETAERIAARLRRAVQLGIAAGVLATLAWLVMQAADMASADSVGDAMSAVPVVVSDTDFGHLIVTQIAVLLAVAAVIGRRPSATRQRVALGLAAVATALQAGHSHAASMQPESGLLLISVVIHLLAAGGWLGGLLPLLLVVRDAPPKAATLAAAWFSPLGKFCIASLVLSAGIQFCMLVKNVPGLVGTAYGWMVLAKLTLFGVLIGFAALNRYRLAPALLRGRPETARRLLLGSIAVQAGFGLAIIGAAAVLSSLPPAMHVQPVWPFADRFSLAAVREDPEFRNEVFGAVLALAAAAILLVVAVLRRGAVRSLAVAAAAVIAWFAVPHLDLLLVPAYPTTYYHSPTGFAATAIVRGAAVYPGSCAICHGAEGRGDGPAARQLPVPPADLTAAHLWGHSDGELFWWLSHGIEAPEGGPAMPGFAAILSEDDRWDLIDYIRAHNAGLTFHRSGTWSPPVQAPGLQAGCTDGRTLSLADLRGGFVRVVIGTAPPLPEPRVTTILATADQAARPSAGLCIVSDTAVPRAYAIISGIALPMLAGTQFLIDGGGWLRAVQPQNAAPTWNDPQTLAAEIRLLDAHPIAADQEGGNAPMAM